MFALRRIINPVRQVYFHKGPYRVIARDFNNRSHTGVISTPPTTPVSHVVKVAHCGLMLFIWLAPIGYFFVMLETYQGGPPSSDDE